MFVHHPWRPENEHMKALRWHVKGDIRCDSVPDPTIWGCGPVGQFAIQSAWMLGAGRVIAIDQVPERLTMARHVGRAETLDFNEVGIYDALMEMTKARGPDRCIDCVGTEADAAATSDSLLDKAKAAAHLGTDRPHVLREAIMSCRKGGTISVLASTSAWLITFPSALP
jgi:threonine dehydrogenase-like Zn-dependent dehydrogenase